MAMGYVSMVFFLHFLSYEQFASSWRVLRRVPLAKNGCKNCWSSKFPRSIIRFRCLSYCFVCITLAFIKFKKWKPVLSSLKISNNITASLHYSFEWIWRLIFIISLNGLSSSYIVKNNAFFYSFNHGIRNFSEYIILPLEKKKTNFDNVQVNPKILVV